VTARTHVKADTFRERDGLIVAGAYVAGAAVAAAAVAIVAALAAYGWKDVGWVLTAPGSQGVLRAMGTTTLIVITALPVTVGIGLFAAAAANDASIGGFAGPAVRESIEWASGIPPVVIGLSVFFCAIALHGDQAVAAAVAALVLLNLPNAAARLTQAFGTVPRDAREAAAALGASPAASYFALVQPAATWAVAGAVFTLGAQMIGETSAVAVAVSASDGPEPLSVQIWHYASNVSMAGTEAAACIVLVVAVGILMGLSRACARRNSGAVS
jgi:ABC-type phosphate transport system permease subunit